MSEHIIKVCGITRRQDAETAAEAGATALGFIFYAASPRCVSPARVAELAQGLALCKVGIFVETSAHDVAQIMRIAKLDVAQMYGGEAPAEARVWRAFRVDSGFDPDSASGAEAVLLDGPRNGVGFDWAQARNTGFKVIVAGGLDAANVGEAIRMARPWGVDASSKLEVSPGIKDPEKVIAFVRAAKDAYDHL